MHKHMVTYRVLIGIHLIIKIRLNTITFVSKIFRVSWYLMNYELDN